MLEYFTYKRYKKHQQHQRERNKAAATTAVQDVPSAVAASVVPADAPSQQLVPYSPVLDREEQSFFERLTREGGRSSDSEDDTKGNRPPLPPRVKTPDLTWDSDSELFVRESDKSDKSDRNKAEKKRRWPWGKEKKQEAHPHPDHLAVPGRKSSAGSVSSSEEAREGDDLARVLEDLNLAGQPGDGETKKNKMGVALTAESAEVVRQFVLVVQDLVRGVPTAADDLKRLLDDRDGTLARGFEKLPKSLRKLVAQLPSKLTSSIAPELLAAAAESQGVKYDAAAESTTAAAKNAAKAMLLPLVTKPGSIVSMLKAIMNALKLRWPAFIGTSMIWSVALSLLLFVLWYCHKRGREVRLEKEAAEAGSPDGQDAVDVLPPGMLPPPPIGDGRK